MSSYLWILSITDDDNIGQYKVIRQAGKQPVNTKKACSKQFDISQSHIVSSFVFHIESNKQQQHQQKKRKESIIYN